SWINRTKKNAGKLRDSPASYRCAWKMTELFSTFGNDRRRRGFALADSVRLCRGGDTKESHRHCRQKSNLLHEVNSPFVMTV
ncbi:MAG: hypothetical protein WCD69_17235, partial [Xanthobacteraceae bacterium]